jgi:hypothetical protein
LIGATVGAVLILLVWGYIERVATLEPTLRTPLRGWGHNP